MVFFWQQQNFISNWSPKKLGHQRVFPSGFDPVHRNVRATWKWGVQRNYRGNLQGMSKSALLSPFPRSLWNCFHSILMSCWVIKKKKKVFFGAPHLWRPFSQPVSHYYTHGLGASTIHTFLCSAADELSSSHPCVPSPPPLKNSSPKEELLYLGDSIALRKLLADVDVLTSGQC